MWAHCWGSRETGHFLGHLRQGWRSAGLGRQDAAPRQTISERLGGPRRGVSWEGDPSPLHRCAPGALGWPPAASVPLEVCAASRQSEQWRDPSRTSL